MKANKLRNCPFCEPHNKRISVRRMGNKGYKVICSNCGAGGPYIAIKDWHSNKMIAQQQAIDAWNDQYITRPVTSLVKDVNEFMNSVMARTSQSGETTKLTIGNQTVAIPNDESSLSHILEAIHMVLKESADE